MNLPHEPTIPVENFKIAIPEEDVADFRELIRVSKLGPHTFENSHDDLRYGLGYAWMKEAKEYWETKFDWRQCEERLNQYPHFKAKVKDDDGEEYDIHFVGVFSERKDAIPYVFTHGWPGSFLEFLDLFSLLQKRYTPATLPYHLIAPSMPGYTFSSPPSFKHDFGNGDTARLIHKLVTGLGFKAYGAQGGDVGSYISRILAAKYDECKVLHLNFCVMGKPACVESAKLSAKDQEYERRVAEFTKTGSAYAVEHGTRPSTIGFTLSASPLALLAWIGEKYLTWTDETPSLETILETVSLYWLTDTFPTSIYMYRGSYNKPGVGRYFFHADEEFHCKKPMGYSFFPKEIYPIPRPYIETTGNLVYFKEHEKGGHFAAMEQPQALADDMEAFLAQYWQKQW